uniref:Acyl-homoserine-lactone synthase n=1 Tax=Pantoea sp. CWB304 TaxID=543533 RepID=B3VN67_9GAMM|nr:PanI [Pantoea sp. CWB304]
MLEIFDLNYSMLANEKSEEIFTLRKKIFKDRLDWAVKCTNQMEFDEYDNLNTNYILGVYKDKVICSLRFIETKYNNMFSGTFCHYFKGKVLPEGNYIEASRFFVDKLGVKKSELRHYPVSSMLFLAMINYSIKYNYQGIYAVVSHAMLAILKRSGWRIQVVEQGISEKNERIYLLFMPADNLNRLILIDRIKSECESVDFKFDDWPLLYSFLEL